MVQRTLGWLTIALLAAGFGGANSFAGPLEDSLTAPAERDACTREFYSLRQEAEERGKLIKTASTRHATPEEACELIKNYGQSEIKLLQYVDTNAARCGFPPYIADQLRAGHKNTETMQNKVCAMVREAQKPGPARPVGDFDDAPLVR